MDFKKILYKHVPQNLIDRPKMGFSVPLGDWLRGPLKDWAENLINQQRINEEGYLNPVTVKTKWDEHNSYSRNWQYQLWNILMFQSWLEYNK